MMGSNSMDEELLQAQARIAELERTVERHEAYRQLHEAGQKALVRNLDAARQQALAAMDAKDHFLATMSHEFRTPMNGILGAVQLLADASSDHERDELMCSIESSARGLQELLSDVLDFSKYGESSMDLLPIDFDLTRLAEEAMETLGEHAVGGNGVDLRLELSPDLPASVRGDVGCMRQLLRIVLSNAIKFTDKGEVKLDIAPSETREGHVVFSVSDTGIGIHPDHLNRIFEPFTQEDPSTTRRFGGSGLGLSIAKRIVDAMRGTLEVESVQGEGSTFCLEIPLPCSAQAAEEEVPSVAPADDQRHLKGAALRVLLVDDQTLNLKIGEKFLGRFGAVVETARNGQEALAKVAASAFDLVLMDCTMPVMDGFEATRRIRSLQGKHGQVPIVALTALAMPGDRERCLGAGMDGYLAKPIRREELGRALDEFAREGGGDGLMD